MYKLLIADDEAIEREAIRYFISEAGFEFAAVGEAGNGIQAVAVAAEMIPDIIVIDIKMPGKDGLEAAREIREFNPDCKIIFLTAFSEFEYARKAIKVKAEDFIIKPANSENLIAVLTNLLAQLEHGKTMLALSEPAMVKGEEVAGGPTALLVEKVCKFIDQNYSQNIKLEEMCRMVGFSKYYFSRVFKHYKNMNMIDYITFRRIQKAKELLKDPRISIKEISFVVGYNEPNYLTSVFKKWEGISPTEYRNKECR
jgi:two-component system response regulator YesN